MKRIPKETTKYEQCRRCVYLNGYTKDCELADVVLEQSNRGVPRKYKVKTRSLRGKVSDILTFDGKHCLHRLERMGFGANEEIKLRTRCANIRS